jgi:pyruvate/2-oxoglutarate dehydrogenase complex dihydrolipoamide acyltransferase (E2) component
MQAVLVMFRSDGERRSFSIARDMTVVGRREDCDLRIPLGEVSRKHCRLVRDGDTLKIEDLGSSNGTFLNGRRVQEALLSPGDSIQVGPVVFVLQIDGTPADDELSPVTMDAAAAGGAGSGMAGAAEDDADAEDELRPQPAGGGGGAGGEVEELEPLEEVEAEPAETLEEIGDAGDDDAAAPAPATAARAASPPADDPDVLEPLEELEELDQNFDITEEAPASSASGDLRIDLDADEKRR